MTDKQTTETKVSNYELMFILLPDLGEDAIFKELNEIRKFISTGGGEIYNEDIIGKRDLAYRINGHEEGYYIVFNMTFATNKIKELEKLLNIHPMVLRQLILATPAFYKGAKLVEYNEEELKEEAKRKKAEEKEKEKKPVKKVKKEKIIPKEESEKKSEEVLTPVKPKSAKKEKKEKIEKIPEKVSEKTPEKEPEKAPEVEKTVEPEKQIKKEKKTTLDEVDEKLRNIINNPDITL